VREREEKRERGERDKGVGDMKNERKNDRLSNIF
jgi:hypothetical protein